MIEKILLALCSFGMLYAPCFAAEECALSIEILDEQLKLVDWPIRGELIDSDDHIVTSATSFGGILSFCDFPLGVFRVRVGDKGACGTVTLEGVRRIPRTFQRRSVIRDSCRTAQGPSFVYGCQYIYKIVDDDLKSLLRAKILRDTDEVVLDRDAIAMISIARGRMLAIQVEHDGYASAAITESCVRSGIYYRNVIMRQMNK